MELDIEAMQRLGYNDDAILGVMYAHELPADDLLAVARDGDSAAWAAMNEFMGPGTNPYWITSTAAVAAYERHLIDEQELDWITR